MTPMWSLVMASLGGIAIAALLAERRAARRELDSLASHVAELSGRVQGAEQSAAEAVARAEVAESVLIEKGIADQEELEAARRRYDAEGEPGYVRARDGALH